MKNRQDLSVLFVDDEESILFSMRRFLRLEPFRMFFAESGRKALEILDQENIDILVTDLRMPGISGLELLVTAQKKFPRLRCLVLSATTDAAEKDEVEVACEIASFLSKPLEPDIFLATLKEVKNS
jgi:response regulator RpfG family c-di-GMP phosphodiesterase